MSQIRKFDLPKLYQEVASNISERVLSTVATFTALRMCRFGVGSMGLWYWWSELGFHTTFSFLRAVPCIS